MSSVLLSIVAPCFNESENIPELTERVFKTFVENNISGELVLVNDGSKDNTLSVIKEHQKKFSNLVLVNHEVNKGIEAGWNSGIAAASGTFVCLIDADLQNRPEDIHRMLKEIMASHVDIVQGVRINLELVKDSRYYLSKGLNFLLNSFFNMKSRDNKSGFVLAYKEVLEDILFHRLSYRYFQSFITVAAAAKGYSVKQIDTVFDQRKRGKSFLAQLPLKVIYYCIVDLFKGLYEYRISQFQETTIERFLLTHRPQKEDAPITGWRKLLWELMFKTMFLHKWMLSTPSKDYYNQLKKSQWLTSEDIKKLQLKKLKKLIIHAYNHVPYYRDKMIAQGLTPSDFSSLEDLSKLPFLSKSDVRKNLNFYLMSDNHKKSKILRIQTSGSTGEPFVCYADKHQLEIRWASTQRSLEWTGYVFGDKCARLWHQTLGMSWSQIFREKFDAFLNRRLFIPAFQMTEENIKNFVQKLKGYNPVLIDGYAESFNFLAYYLKSQNLDGVNPKGIVSSAQILPDASRTIIEKSFKCGVFDKYGSREFSGIAYECDAHAGHHVIGDSYIVEILKDGAPAKPGEMGEVVITDLNNYCLPMIRYRVGDLAVAVDNNTQCSCGRGLPRIGKIEGRVQAVIFGANGAFIPGTFFAHYFKDHDRIIRQYQVVQEAKGEVTLRVIKGPQFESAKFENIVNGLKEYLGSNTRIDVQFTESMELGRTGKHQGSISKVQYDFQNLSN